MSTADSNLNSSSISLIHDIIKPLFKNIKTNQELLITKIATFILGCLSIMVATQFKTVFDIILITSVSWIAIILVPTWVVIFNFRTSTYSFVAGTVSGIVTLAFWKYFDFEKVTYVNAYIPAILMNALSFFILNYCWKGNKTLRKPVKKEIESKINFKDTSSSHWNLQNSPFAKGCKKVLSQGLVETLFQKTQANGIPYMAFGGFALINYVIPYFAWTEATHHSMTLTLRLIAGILCFFLFLKGNWPETLQKYFPIYWYGTLLFCLPFFSTYLLLDEQSSISSWINIVLALFLLAILVDWISFIGLLLSGSILGFVVYGILHELSSVFSSMETLYWLSYIYFFTILIGLIFSRYRERIQDEHAESLKSMAGAIAHEMRTPLANVMLKGRILERSAESMEKALQESSERSTLTLGNEVKGLSKLSQSLLRVTKGTQNLIDLLLNNLSQNFENLSQEPLSMKYCLEHTLEEFSFKPGQRPQVHVEMTSDFQFKGNLELVMHVFFNLLKNSLYFIQSSGKGEVFIQLVSDERSNRIVFKDTGPGIEKDRLAHLFKPFYTKRAHGTGVGLSFCKKAIESMGGKITVASDLGVHTTFTITFPRIHTQSIFS